VAAIGLVANTAEDRGTLRLQYSVGRDGAEKSAQDYVVPLVTSRLISGGLRWWFLCPACRACGPPCGRRVGKLYLPPSGTVFACRRCYDLVYTSSRESRKWDRLYQELATETGYPVGLVKRVLNGDRPERGNATRTRRCR
jgi:hypothetical protein